MNSSTTLRKAAQDLVEARLRSGAAVRFFVSTTSMLPTLRPGDALIVERVTEADISPGMLVIVRNGNAWVVHRLIQRETSGGGFSFLTKGDNQYFADPGFDGAAPAGAAKCILRGEHIVDLFSWRARAGGRVLAWSSRVQAGWSKRAPNRSRKIILEGMRRGISALSRLVYSL